MRTADAVRSVARERGSRPPDGVSARTWRRLRLAVAAGREPRVTPRVRVALDQARLVAREPGVYDLPAADYHADPVPGGSLSSTGARLLLRAPALFRHRLDHPEPPRRTFDLGSAAHKLVLGVGDELAVLDHDSYRSKAAQTERDEARAAGAVPLLAHEYEQVQAMAAALRAHPIASALFRPGAGLAEQTLIWRDQLTGVWQRALVDWLRTPPTGQRLVVADYKTSDDASPDAVSRATARYGYHVQGAWYLDGVLSLGLADDAVFVLVVQEKDPPYLVTVIEPDDEAMMWGRMDVERALRIYRACQLTGEWPGYSTDVECIELPRYLTREYEAARDRGAYDSPLPEGTDNDG